MARDNMRLIVSNNLILQQVKEGNKYWLFKKNRTWGLMNYKASVINANDGLPWRSGYKWISKHSNQV